MYVDDILTTILMYFGQSWMLIIGICFVLVILLSKKTDRFFWLGYVALFGVFVCNNFARGLTGKISEGGSEGVYYRMLWMIPYAFLVTVAIILSGKRISLNLFSEKKLCVIILCHLLILCLYVMTNNRIDRWHLAWPDNELLVSDEAVEVSDIIDKDAKLLEIDNPSFFSAGELFYRLPIISESAVHALGRELILGYNETKTGTSGEARFVQSVIDGSKDYVGVISSYLDTVDIDYVITYSALDMKDFYSGCGLDLIASTDNYDIFRNQRRVIKIYDEKKHLVEVTTTDSEGNPVVRNGKYATVKYTYDSKRNKASTRYYDENGKPAPQTNGASGFLTKYDIIHRAVEYTYLNENDEPFIMKAGYASVKYDLNSKGQIIAEYYYDENLNPIALSKGEYGKVKEYNEDKKLSKVTYLDKDHNPVELAYAATEEYEYDSVGNCAGYKYYDIEGNPVLYDGKYWYLKRIFNDKKQVILEEYFGTDGNPTVLPNGAYAYRKEYDESGNAVKMTYLDEEGNPTINTSGYSIVHRNYNTWNKVSREEYYDTKEKPVTLSIGQFAVEYDYDESGAVINKRYYDLEGNIVSEKHEG